MPSNAALAGSGAAVAVTASRNRNPRSSRKLNASVVLSEEAGLTKLNDSNVGEAAGFVRLTSVDPPNTAEKSLGTPPSGSNWKVIMYCKPGVVARVCWIPPSDPSDPKKASQLPSGTCPSPGQVTPVKPVLPVCVQPAKLWVSNPPLTTMFPAFTCGALA